MTANKNYAIDLLNNGLQVGDYLALHENSHRSGYYYEVTEITEKQIIATIVYTEEAKRLLRLNKHYCKKDIAIDIEKAGSYALYLDITIRYQ